MVFTSTVFLGVFLPLLLGVYFLANAKAQLFEPKKLVRAKRHGAQKAQDFRSIISDLRLVVMTYQSFNTDRLDEREKEIANVFEAMREARKKFTNSKKTR